MSTAVYHSSDPTEDAHLIVGDKSPLTSDSSSSKPTSADQDYCEQGCFVCLIYSCIACDTRDCCPNSTICDYYCPAGAGLFLWVAFTFIYDLYDVFNKTANILEIIVYCCEMFLCDIPIMVCSLADKAPYLKYTFYTQLAISVAHTIVCIIEMDGYYNDATFDDGLLALLFDVPFEFILALILIPLYKEQVPLWQRPRAKHTS